jgi:hypothetical protein
VSGNGAYEGEMNEFALFTTALRAAVPTQPDAMLGANLVPRLAEIARASTIEAETQAARRRPRSRLALVARVGIVVALIPLVLAGLAFAGVTVPAPARSAFDSVGITLPNQPSDEHAGSKAVNQTTTTITTTTGNDVSSAAKTSAKGQGGNSAAAHRHALQQRAKARGKAIGHSRGRAIGLTGATPPGHSGETGPPAHSNAGGDSATHTTTHTTPQPHTIPTTPGNANGHSK